MARSRLRPFTTARCLSTLLGVMATTESVTSDFSSDRYDADELGQYRSLSSMAVVSFLLGLCSFLMLASPVLVVVPLAAIAMALLAMRGIANSDGGLTGTRLALSGIGLAVLFGVAAYARVAVRDELMQQQVEQASEQWLGMAADGDVDAMLEFMTKPAADKLKPAVEVAQPGSIFGDMLNSALMRQDPLVVALTGLKEGGALEFRVTDVQVFATSQPAQGLIKYVVANPNGDEIVCSMGLKRFKASQNTRVWLIDSWQLE